MEEQKSKKIYRRWYFWVLVILVLIFIVISSSDSPKSSTNNQPSNQEEIFKIGDQVKRGDSVITVEKVNRNWQSSNQFDKPQNSENVFTVITVSVQNNGNSDLNLSSFWDFKLEDANGVQRNEAIGGIGLNKLTSSATTLSPGGKISGDLIFEAPKDSTRLILHYKPLISFGKPAKIELQ